MAKEKDPAQTESQNGESSSADNVVAEKSKNFEAGSKSGVKADRERISAIIDSDEAKGREDQAKHLALKTSMSVDDAIAVLSTAPIASTSQSESPLDTAMDDTEQPEVGADAGGSEASKSDQIFSDFQASTNYKTGEK